MWSRFLFIMWGVGAMVMLVLPEEHGGGKIHALLCAVIASNFWKEPWPR